MIPLNHRVEIRPAYNSETGERDTWDEIAGCWGVVKEHGRNGEHRVELLDGSEAWVYVTRLRDRSEPWHRSERCTARRRAGR